MKTINSTELKLIKGKWCLNGKPYTGIGKTVYATFYYKDGKVHRDNDLPAIERADGSKEWWVNGKRIYSWEQYQRETNCSKEQLVMYILTHSYIPCEIMEIT